MNTRIWSSLAAVGLLSAGPSLSAQAGGLGGAIGGAGAAGGAIGGGGATGSPIGSGAASIGGAMGTSAYGSSNAVMPAPKEPSSVTAKTRSTTRSTEKDAATVFHLAATLASGAVKSTTAQCKSDLSSTEHAAAENASASASTGAAAGKSISRAANSRGVQTGTDATLNGDVTRNSVVGNISGSANGGLDSSATVNRRGASASTNDSADTADSVSAH